MCMRCLGVVSQTQKSYSRLIAALRLMNSDGWECELLVGAFTGLSWELRDRNRDEILAFSHVPAHVREHHARRLALDAWSFDGLWNAMKAFAEPGSDGKYEAGGGGAADDMDGIRLIETLVRRFPEAAGERALDTVRKIDPSGKTGLVEVSCVEILGRVKSTAAVPLLLEMLGAGDVDLRRSLIEALARLGSPDLVSRLESIYQDTPSEAERFTIIGILDGINIPETETALTRLLDYESDFDLRRALAGSLIKLCAFARCSGRRAGTDRRLHARRGLGQPRRADPTRRGDGGLRTAGIRRVAPGNRQAQRRPQGVMAGGVWGRHGGAIGKPAAAGSVERRGQSWGPTRRNGSSVGSQGWPQRHLPMRQRQEVQEVLHEGVKVRQAQAARAAIGIDGAWAVFEWL
jgi:hypothetical protein